MREPWGLSLEIVCTVRNFFMKYKENEVTRKSCCPQQVVFCKLADYKCKPVDYSKVAVYKCKLADYSKVADYKCKVVDYCKAAVYKCKLADYSKVAVYKCKLVDYSKVAVYKCKPAVYTCKVLNSRFTTVLLITLLDTVEVTPFLQICFFL